MWQSRGNPGSGGRLIGGNSSRPQKQRDFEVAKWGPPRYAREHPVQRSEDFTGSPGGRAGGRIPTVPPPGKTLVPERSGKGGGGTVIVKSRQGQEARSSATPAKET